MRIVNLKDFLAGTLFFAFGVGFAFLAPGYALGTPARMGAGFFPMVLGLCLAAIGLIVILRSCFVAGEPIEPGKLRPFAAMLGAITLFGVLLNPLGLVASLIILVIVGGYASPDFKAKEGVMLAVGLAASSALLFVILLKLPLPLWPSLLRAA